MKIWYVRDGQKMGPLEVTEARGLVRDEVITKKTKVWHQGMDQWVPAKEMEALRVAFESLKAGEAVQGEIGIGGVEELQKRPFLPGRRMAARWFDVLLYQMVLVLIFRATGTKIAMANPEELEFWRVLIQYIPLPLMIIEGAFLNGLGATPGKLLLGLQVSRGDGSRLGVVEGALRSLRVYALGFGMYLHPLLIVVCHLVNFFVYKKKGATVWDWRIGYRVEGDQIGPGRWLLVFGAFLAVMMTTTFVTWPELKPMVEEMQREALERAGK